MKAVVIACALLAGALSLRGEPPAKITPEQALSFVREGERTNRLGSACLAAESAEFMLIDFSCLYERVEAGSLDAVKRKEVEGLPLPKVDGKVLADWIPIAAFRYKGYIVTYFSIGSEVVKCEFNYYMLSTNAWEPNLLVVYDAAYKPVHVVLGH